MVYHSPLKTSIKKGKLIQLTQAAEQAFSWMSRSNRKDAGSYSCSSLDVLGGLEIAQCMWAVPLSTGQVQWCGWAVSLRVSVPVWLQHLPEVLPDQTLLKPCCSELILLQGLIPCIHSPGCRGTCRGCWGRTTHIAPCSPCHKASPFCRRALLTDLLTHGREGLPTALCFSCKPDFFGMVGFYPHAHPPSLPNPTPPFSFLVVFVFRESA